MNDRAVNILAYIFGTVFGLAACGIIWFIADTYISHFAARSWVPAEAKVLDFGVKSSRSGTGAKATLQSRLKVSYEYVHEGIRYTGDRTDFSRGSDNFSGKRISAQMKALRSGEVSVYVNPLNPSESVFDRSLPGPQIAFAIFFLFFPCGLGTACIMGALSFILGKIRLRFFERFMMPVLGMIHGSPAVYPIIFDPGAFTLGSWMILIFFSVIFVWSLWAFVRRLFDPTLGLPEWKEKLEALNTKRNNG